MRPKPLKKLPRTHSVWEAGMVHAQHQIDGMTIKGLLIVVERGTGAIRVASPVMEGESPASLFRQAFQVPAAPAKAGRPKHVVFDDPWLRDQVSSVLDEAGNLSVTTEATPALDDAIARIMQQAGAPVAPGIDSTLLEWRAALQDLIRLAPWKALDATVVFSFAGGGLDTSVATLLGMHGELVGVLLYPSRQDLECHRSTQGSGTLDGRAYSALHLMLERRSGLSADELERCMRSALQFPPGLYPRVYAFTPSGLAQVSTTEQARLLSVVRAITALCRAEQTALASGARRALTVDGLQVTGARD